MDVYIFADPSVTRFLQWVPADIRPTLTSRQLGALRDCAEREGLTESKVKQITHRMYLMLNNFREGITFDFGEGPPRTFLSGAMYGGPGDPTFGGRLTPSYREYVGERYQTPEPEIRDTDEREPPSEWTPVGGWS